MESTVTPQKRRIPALLWEALEEACFEKDKEFLREVSRILGVPAPLLKRQILGVSGMPTTVLVEEGPWWQGSQCAAMDSKGSLWTRCGFPAEADGQCWNHRRPVRRYDDPVFTTLPVYKPARLEGKSVWVDEKGLVYDEIGEILKEWRIDVTNGCAYHGICMDVEPKQEADCAATCKTDAGTEETETC